MFTTGCASIQSESVPVEQLSADLSNKKLSIMYSNTSMMTNFAEDSVVDMDGLLFDLIEISLSDAQNIEKSQVVIPEGMSMWQKILLAHQKQSVPQRVLNDLFKDSKVTVNESPLAKNEEGTEAAALQAFAKSDNDYMLYLSANGVFSFKSFQWATQYLTYTGTMRLLKKSAQGPVSVWEGGCHVGPMEGEKQEVHRSDIFEGKAEKLEKVLTFVSSECSKQFASELKALNLS